MAPPFIILPRDPLGAHFLLLGLALVHRPSIQPMSRLRSFTNGPGIGQLVFSHPFHYGDVKSVYVRNLPFTVSASEIEEEFKIFGKLKLDDDIGVCYAFVEFEDIIGVQNAIKV
ncbi:hypothetical protein ACSBR1_039972 [Camellia fascicularis]